jgi:hypothetical protein
VTALAGIVFLAASAAAFWRLLPADGRVHRLATMPVIESLLPLAIVGGFAIGVALVFASVSIG